MRYKSLLLALPLVWGAAHASEGVVHHKLNGMPISESVEISSSKNIIFLSGKVPTKISKDAPEGVLASYGNTEAQTINIGAPGWLRSGNEGCGENAGIPGRRRRD